MSSTIADLCQNAFRHITFLVDNIGARPAGSEAERRAFDYVAQKLTDCGYGLNRSEVHFPPMPRFFALYVLAGILLVLCCWGVLWIPWLTLFLPVFIMVLPQTARWLLRKRRGKVQSQNLIAYANTDIEKPVLILCAHVDTGRANAFRSRFMLRLYDSALFVVQRVAVGAALVAMIIMLDFPVPNILIQILKILGSVVGGWWILMELFSQLGRKVQYSPGAVDNASGVGVVLALAEYYAYHPPGKIRLGFLFTGAEETGMHGASAFASSLKPQDNVAIMNFDIVGSGKKIHYITAEGVIHPIHTNMKMNRLIQQVDPKATGLWYTRRSGDYLPFLEKGIPAVSLQMGANPLVELSYHTIWDTMGLIQISTLDQVIRVSTGFIQRFKDLHIL